LRPGNDGFTIFCRHEIGEDFLHPHVVEPAHGDEVPEPHVRGLVRDHAGTSEFLVLRRGLVKQEPGGVVEDGAGVLHPPELKRRDKQEIELSEGIADRGVLLEPFERGGMQVENRVAVSRHLRRIRLAVKHSEPSSVAGGGFDLITPRGKCEQIGRQRIGFRKPNRRAATGSRSLEFRRVGERFPAGRNVER
jgi:hypothetical protein